MVDCDSLGGDDTPFAYRVLTRTQEVDSTLSNTEIYSKFAKPSIQIAGSKNIQHNAYKERVARYKKNIIH